LCFAFLWRVENSYQILISFHWHYHSKQHPYRHSPDRIGTVEKPWLAYLGYVLRTVCVLHFIENRELSPNRDFFNDIITDNNELTGTVPTELGRLASAEIYLGTYFLLKAFQEEALITVAYIVALLVPTDGNNFED
jgi:hypothetical protein